MESSIFSKKLFEYADRFGENFPTYNYLYASEAEIIEKINECLEKGKPIETENFDPEIDI
jgi:hypothetical protein